VLRNPKAILALLTALNLLNYVDRFVLSAVLAPMREDLHLSGAVAGWLPTFFLLGYFATSPIFGHLGDRGGRGTRGVLLALGVAVWSLATLGTGLARGTLGLCMARVLVGVGEASYATIAPTLIDDVAPPERRSRWMAIFSAATPLGSALGYIVGGQVVGTYGWRTAFFVAGAPGIIAALLCVAIVEPSRSGPQVEPGSSWAAALRELASTPLYRGVVLGYCAYAFAIGGFAYWAPTYLHLRYGLAPGRASVLFGLLALASGAIGTLLGGPLADRSVARRRGLAPPGAAERPDADDGRVAQANLSVTALACAVGAPLAAAAIAAPTATIFFAVGLPCLTALFVLSGPINVAILKSAPHQARANAMGLAIFAIHGLGDLWSPPLIGWLGDRASMPLAMYTVPVVFAVGAAVWWRTLSASDRLTATARVR
jgi:MFS transporter, Spinster family, sphingosine-1-phosphate transporter